MNAIQGQEIVVVCPTDKTELVVVPLSNGIVYRVPGEIVTRVVAPGVYTTMYYCPQCKGEFFE